MSDVENIELLTKLKRIECQNRIVKCCIALAGLVVGAVVVTAQVPPRPSTTLKSLFSSRAESSKLDWIFLSARVSVLEELGPTNPSPTYGYDPKSDRVLVRAFVSSSWLSSTPAQKMRDTAEEYCAAVFIT